MANGKEVAKTKRSAQKTIYETFKLLQANGNELPRQQIIEHLEKNVEFEPWELEHYASNGQVKWLTIFLFYTIDCIKAGWLKKNKGIWYLTPEGEAAIKYGPEKLQEEAGKAYYDWVRQNKTDGVEEIAEEIPDNEKGKEITLEQLEAQAEEGIGKYLEAMEPFAFQNLSALLLKAMGYYINYEAPPGKDGGIDVIAFKDALGHAKPRIKVQVKRFTGTKVDVDTIKILKSNLHVGEDIGICITSSSFTKDAIIQARDSNVHIKLIDKSSFIKLWIEHYDNLSYEEQMKLPIRPIYFLGVKE